MARVLGWWTLPPKMYKSLSILNVYNICLQSVQYIYCIWRAGRVRRLPQMGTEPLGVSQYWRCPGTSPVIRALSKFWSATPTWTKNPPLLSPPQTEWPWAPWTDETGLDPKFSLPKWLLLFLLLLAPTKALFKPLLFQCYQCDIEKPFSSKGERPNVEGCKYPSVIGFTCGSLWGNN